MNVSGETTKPVENMRRSEGEAPSGKYTVFVQNDRFHESPGPTPYCAGVGVGGVIKRFNGIIGGKGETGPDSHRLIYELQFDPSMRNRAPMKRPPINTPTIATTLSWLSGLRLSRKNIFCVSMIRIPFSTSCPARSAQSAGRTIWKALWAIYRERSRRRPGGIVLTHTDYRPDRICVAC